MDSKIIKKKDINWNEKLQVRVFSLNEFLTEVSKIILTYDENKTVRELKETAANYAKDNLIYQTILMYIRNHFNFQIAKFDLVTTKNNIKKNNNNADIDDKLLTEIANNEIISNLIIDYIFENEIKDKDNKIKEENEKSLKKVSFDEFKKDFMEPVKIKIVFEFLKNKFSNNLEFIEIKQSENE